MSQLSFSSPVSWLARTWTLGAERYSEHGGSVDDVLSSSTDADRIRTAFNRLARGRDRHTCMGGKQEDWIGVRRHTQPFAGWATTGEPVGTLADVPTDLTDTFRFASALLSNARGHLRVSEPPRKAMRTRAIVSLLLRPVSLASYGSPTPRGPSARERQRSGETGRSSFPRPRRCPWHDALD